jgi:hypothetical protein
VLQESPPASPAEQVSYALRCALGRPATQDEQIALTRFLTEQAALLRTENRQPSSLATPLPNPAHLEPADAAAWTDLCLALLNSSEFLYID